MNNKYPKKYKPLRTFSWSRPEDKTPGQKLVEDTTIEWYEAKNRIASETYFSL